MPTDFTSRFLSPGFANSQIEEVQASAGHDSSQVPRRSLSRVAQVLFTQDPDRSDLIASGVSLMESDLTAI